MRTISGLSLGLLAVIFAGSVSIGNGQSRISYNNQQVFLNGSNVAWVNFAQDLGGITAFDTVGFRTVFDSIHVHGGNSLRLWLHTTGQYTPQFNAGGKVIGPGTNAIANLHKILDMAWARKIGLQLCLWSFDMMTKTLPAEVTNRSELMLTDTVYTMAYVRNSLIPMVAAVKGHPAIISWEVFNEAEGMSNEFGWSTTYHVPMSGIQMFVNLVAGAIHRTDSTAKVTTGAWAMTVQSDVTLIAKSVDLQTRLNAMTEAEKKDIEDRFAARHGFHISAAEIISKFAATTNLNYYRDDRLVAAGGDPDGTLDLYTDHYYDWEGTALSPFHHPYSVWNLTKPLVIAEFYPLNTLTIPYTNLYDLLHTNGYAGGLSWAWNSGGSSVSQDSIDRNTMAVTQKLFSEFPDEIELSPVSGKIYSYVVVPTSIDSGEVSVLDWKTTLGSTATVNGASVPIRGTMVVTPSTTTPYTLRASGTSHDSSTVVVTVYQTGKIISFSASPTTIVAGDAAILRWSAAHGSSVFLNSAIVNRVDSLVVHPDSTTTYRLTSSGAIADTAYATINVVPVDQIDRALGRTIIASSTSTTPGFNNKQSLVDGDTTTQWASASSDNQWIQCNLGQNYFVKKVVIKWGNNYATSFGIWGGPNSSNFTLAKTITDGTGGTSVIDSINQDATVVMVALTARSSPASGYAIRELEIFGIQRPLGVQPPTTGIPAQFVLAQNYPNPFNPSTTIQFGVPRQSHVTLTVYNLLGQEVAVLVNSDMTAGYHNVQFSGTRLSSGVYFYRIQAGSFVQTKKLVLLR